MNSCYNKNCLAASAAGSPMVPIKRQLSSVAAAFFALMLGSTSAHAVVLNLTTAGASGSINGATYTQFDPSSTGTGVFDSFVQIAPGGSATSSQAYNTTANGTFDVGSSPQHNHSILLSDVPVINGFRRFVLDINENNNASGDQYVSLDNVRLYVGGSANPSTTNLNDPLLGTLVYNMDAGSNNTVALNFALNTGSGSGDMFMLLPDSLFNAFGPSSVVTLYSAFGADIGTLAAGNGLGLPAGIYGQSDGFEEWGAPGGPSVPDGGSTVALLGGALVIMAAFSRRAGALLGA